MNGEKVIDRERERESEGKRIAKREERKRGL